MRSRCTAIYKGGYADVLTATIAAFRAGQAPHLAQIFEVGTGTMLAAGQATKQVWELTKETGVAIDPKTYIPAVRGYYSLADGRMASMPFNSSTAVMWYSKDAFRKAGLDPDKPPTWTTCEAAQAVKARIDADRRSRTRQGTAGTEIPMTTSWLSWIQLEQYSALHDIPFASKADGFEGLDAQLEINSKPHVKHMQRLLDMSKDGHLQIRRARQSAGSVAGLRQGRHPLQLVRHARRHGEERQVRLGRGVSAVRSRDHQIAAELHHRRRQPVDDDRAKPDTATNTRRWRRSCSSSASRTTTPTGISTPAMCR